MKKRIFASLALFGTLLGSSALSLGVVSAAFEALFFGLAFQWWILFAILFLSASIAALCYAFPKEKKDASSLPKFPEFEKFMKECKLSFRGHLKLSALFWILAYRKEKAKSFEDAKKEVFLEVKREIPHVRWIEAILSEIQEELSLARPETWNLDRGKASRSDERK